MAATYTGGKDAILAALLLDFVAYFSDLDGSHQQRQKQIHECESFRANCAARAQNPNLFSLSGFLFRDIPHPQRAPFLSGEEEQQPSDGTHILGEEFCLVPARNSYYYQQTNAA